MKNRTIAQLLVLCFAVGVVAGCADQSARGAAEEDSSLGRIDISTIPFDAGLRLRTATYTPSGKVLVSYAKKEAEEAGHINLAVMDDDGANIRPFFSQTIPQREKDNGIRFMVFPDNRRIFLGDFIIECAPNIDTCEQAKLLPVEYPAEVAGGDHVSHRWSEIIVAPDNEHIAWTTLFADYSAMVFTGKLKKEKAAYKIVSPRIISTLNAFRDDPEHAGGVIPNLIRGGEVKQFIEGGTAISLVGAKNRDLPDTVVQDLMTGEIVPITDTPGYTETTIFSPDERLGIVMTTRFSEPTNMAILGLMPRPYPASLNMGLSMHTYIYSVAGVRKARSGNIGPALIDIEASKTRPGYRGVNLNTQDEWVYHSPMSWHPGGKKAMWLEGRRGAGRHDGGELRMQIVHLPDYESGQPVAAKATPDEIPYAATDLSLIKGFLRQGRNIDVKVHGRYSGHIEYRRTAATIEKKYVNFSDDGVSVYSGSEKNELNPRGNSTYTGAVKLAGPKPGVMDLKITFGPLGDELPSKLIFTRDESGMPLTRGYTEYDGQRLKADSLVP